MDALVVLNLSVSVIGFTISVLGLIMAITTRQMERRTRAYFITFFIILSLHVSCNLFWQVIRQFSSVSLLVLTRSAIFLRSLAMSSLTVLLTGFLLDQSHVENRRRNVTFYMVVALWLTYFGILVYAQFSNDFFYIDAQNDYHHGPYYPLLLLPLILIMVLNLTLYFRRQKYLNEKQRVAFAIYLVAPLAIMSIEMFVFGTPLLILGSAISAMVMFIYILSDQADRYEKQLRENTELRIGIMLGQIQPHFLYNSLGAISRLCKDAPEAKTAINKFARYLRGNMDSLSENKPIPFLTELEHTKTYLELEQLRFGDDLHVEYDLQCTDFLMPTLTLQPLAENAVRYGVRGNESGAGTVTIRTREYDDRYEITVADDGPGFDPAHPTDDDTRSHTGLRNVQEWLHHISSGTLHVESAPGEGCRATIVLPKEDKHADIRRR